MAFQIVDDALDFIGAPDQIGKPVGNDLRQGLFTLPAIYYVQAHPDDSDVRALLNGNARDPGTISRVIAAVRTSGAVDETLREARAFAAQGQLALGRLPPSPSVAALSAVSQLHRRSQSVALRYEWMGNVNQNLEPWPRVLSTPILPPCTSTSCLAIVNPRPVPPPVRERDFSPRQNRSKMWDKSSDGMPAPVSATAISIIPLAPQQPIGPRSRPRACDATH